MCHSMVLFVPIENSTISVIVGAIRIIIIIYIICTNIHVYALFPIIAALYMY